MIEGLVRTVRPVLLGTSTRRGRRSPRIFSSPPSLGSLTTLVRRAAASRKVVLLDQGIAQALWSIGFSAQGEVWQETMRQAASRAPADMIFSIHVAPLNIADRLALRRHNPSRLSGTND